MKDPNLEFLSLDNHDPQYPNGSLRTSKLEHSNCHECEYDNVASIVVIVNDITNQRQNSSMSTAIFLMQLNLRY